MVFQNYALYPHMTVYDNMAFGLKMRKFPKPEIDTRVREAAQMLGIQELLEPQAPPALGRPAAARRGRAARSSGTRRCSSSTSRCRTSTPSCASRCACELKRLHDRLETTAIYVTHDQVEAMTLGDRVVVMKDGLVQQVGEPLTVYAKPRNRFVAGFIGSPAMNFIDCTVTGSDGYLAVDAPGGFLIAVPPASRAALERYRGPAGDRSGSGPRTSGRAAPATRRTPRSRPSSRWSSRSATRS